MERENEWKSKSISYDRLAKLSPSELEELRRREVDNIIEQAPERVRRRLRGLQFEIDARRRLHKSALGSCISISQMMQESLERLNAALQGNAEQEPTREADVIPFPRVRQSPPERPRV